MGKTTVRLYFAKNDFSGGDFLKKELEEGGFGVVPISCLSSEGADHPLPYVEVGGFILQGVAEICGYIHRNHLRKLNQKRSP